jgi:hypothetical protein
MASRSVRSACDCGSQATVSIVSHRMGDQKLLSRALPCFGRHVKPLVPAVLQSLTPTNPHWTRVLGYDPFSLWVIHKEGLCLSSGGINRLMMMKCGLRLDLA